jgi:cell division protein FtsB
MGSMPITKQQDQVPGVSEEVSALQAKNDELVKRNKELEDELAGKIAQASSAALHNYPEAKVERVRDQE